MLSTYNFSEWEAKKIQSGIPQEFKIYENLTIDQLKNLQFELLDENLRLNNEIVSLIREKISLLKRRWKLENRKARLSSYSYVIRNYGNGTDGFFSFIFYTFVPYIPFYENYDYNIIWQLIIDKINYADVQCAYRSNYITYTHLCSN